MITESTSSRTSIPADIYEKFTLCRQAEGETLLFRARDAEINAELVQRINATRKIYVSGTQWDGLPAARFAVATWMVDVERDLKLIQEVLHDVLVSD